MSLRSARSNLKNPGYLQSTVLHMVVIIIHQYQSYLTDENHGRKGVQLRRNSNCLIQHSPPHYTKAYFLKFHSM